MIIEKLNMLIIMQAYTIFIVIVAHALIEANPQLLTEVAPVRNPCISGKFSEITQLTGKGSIIANVTVFLGYMYTPGQ